MFVRFALTLLTVGALQAESRGGGADWPMFNRDLSGSPRGVAYWPGDRNNPARIIFTTANNLVGLNAKTGKLDPGFGREGEVDMVVPYNGVPTIVKNVIV